MVQEQSIPMYQLKKLVAKVSSHSNIRRTWQNLQFRRFDDVRKFGNTAKVDG